MGRLIMSDHEITLIVQNDKSVQLRRPDPDGDLIDGNVDLNDLRLLTIRTFENWLNADKITKRAELEVLGRHLYEALFNSQKIVGAFEKAWTKAREAKQPLRIQLTFKEEAKKQRLASLPWEFLYYPDKGEFLAIEPECVFVRYMALDSPRHVTLEIDESVVRILVVVSQPEALKPVLADRVKEEIKRLEKTAKVDVQDLQDPTLEEWGERLTSFNPHIVHWMGHGEYDRNEGICKIAGVDGNRKLRWWEDRVFAMKFRDMEKSPPNLVVLQMCETGNIDNRNSLNFPGSFTGVAPQLIESDIPAVVAMQYPIQQDYAITFSTNFYKALAERQDVDDAFQKARRGIFSIDDQTANRRVFGTPVLYWRSGGGRMFKASKLLQQIPQFPPPSGQSSVSEQSKSLQARDGIQEARQGAEKIV